MNDWDYRRIAGAYIQEKYPATLGKKKIELQFGIWDIGNEEGKFKGNRILIFTGRRTEVFYLERKMYTSDSEMISSLHQFIDEIASHSKGDELFVALRQLL